MLPPMSVHARRLRRLRSQNPVIDLRVCAPETLHDLSCLDGLYEELRDFGPAAGLRVWVLHDAAVGWTHSAGALHAALRSIYALAVALPLDETAAEAVVLPPAAAASPALVEAVHALGLPVYKVRPAGGLPIQELQFERREVAMMQGPPLRPAGPTAPLGSLYAAMDGAENDEAEASLDASALAYLEGLLDRCGRAPA